MSGLTGEFRHTLDGKGRLMMPARLLKALGDNFHIFGGSDGCLNVFTHERWERLEEEVDSLPREAVRQLRRDIFSTAQDGKVDAQGRVILEKPLRVHAGLDKNVVIVGTGAYVEIWDEAVWDGMAKGKEDNKPYMVQLGI